MSGDAYPVQLLLTGIASHPTKIQSRASNDSGLEPLQEILDKPQILHKAEYSRAQKVPAAFMALASVATIEPSPPQGISR